MSRITELWFVRSLAKRIDDLETENKRLKYSIKLMHCPHCEEVIGSDDNYTTCDGCGRNVCSYCADDMTPDDGGDLYCLLCQTNQCQCTNCIEPPETTCEGCEEMFCINHIVRLGCICSAIAVCLECNDTVIEYLNRTSDDCAGCQQLSCRWHGLMECTCV